MSVFGKSSPKPEYNEVVPSSTPSSNIATSNTAPLTVIAAGTVIDGNIETTDSIRLEGKVKGHLRSSAKVTIGSQASLDGDLSSKEAEISGEVNGVVEISELLTLKATAVIKGDIFTNKLFIEIGATFNGNCTMGARTKQVSFSDKVAAGGK